MTTEEQRIAIAEACGWKYKKSAPEGQSWDGFADWQHPNGAYLCVIPDYLNDLNAMNEAEKAVIRINDKLTVEYFSQLSHFVGPNARSIQDSADIFCATAAQRAEAFLRTIGKWKDECLPNNLQTQQISPSLHELQSR